MANTTENYGLIKPELTDYYTVDVPNQNMDTIDAALATQAAGLGDKAAASTLTAHTGDTGIHVTATEKTRIANAVQSSDVVTTAAANKLLRLNGSGLLPAGITGNAATATTAQNTTSVAGSITVSTFAPTSFIGNGKMWGVG